MNQNDNNYLKKTYEIRNRISELQSKVNKVIGLEMEAKREGSWNEDYIKSILEEFVLDMSFSIEEIEHFIEDSMLTKDDGKKIPEHILLETINQLPN